MVARWSPMAEVARMFDELDRAVAQMTGTQLPQGFGASAVKPAFDLYDSGDQLVVKVALPGVRPEDLEVSIEQSTLHIAGQFGNGITPQEAQQVTWYARGIGYGQFAQTVNLPVPVESDAARAEYENGILTLTLPKAEHARTKRIPVQTHGQLTAARN